MKIIFKRHGPGVFERRPQFSRMIAHQCYFGSPIGYVGYVYTADSIFGHAGPSLGISRTGYYSLDWESDGFPLTNSLSVSQKMVGS